MPPRKRNAPAIAASAPKRAKKVSIGEAADIGKSEPTMVAASGRPRRYSVSEPNYSMVRPKRSSKEVQAAAAAAADTEKKPRGRPRKHAIAAATPRVPPNSSTTTRKRGRKSPALALAKAAKTGPASSGVKKATARQAATVDSETSRRKRGRPATKSKAAASTPARAAPALANKKAGGPPGTKRKSKTATVDNDAQAGPQSSESEGLTANGSDWENAAETDTQYWLMKAEPESRIEKGVDVKFSIDDLMNAAAPQPWDGVRNLAARNNMRAMKKGDLAFFYHSNCKVPGVVGVMQIVEEHSIDESAFDLGHPYYDGKSSREKPKWELVHVQFVQKFPKLITLSDLKSFAKPGSALENLQTLKQSRLSVSSVQPQEWHFIMSLAEADEGEGEEDATDMQTAQVANGHTADEDDDQEDTVKESRGQVLKGVVRNLNDEETNGVDEETNGIDEETNGVNEETNGVGKDDAEGEANTSLTNGA